MKRSFLQAAVVLILLYGCTTWTLTKRLEKKFDSNYTRMLRAILNKSWRQRPTKHQLYGDLPLITKTIKVWRTRHVGHCWRSRDELINDVLLWTPSHGRAKAGRPAWTYIQQLCEDTGCSPEDLPEAMNDREEWRERVRDIRAGGPTLWWWLLKELYKLSFCQDGETLNSKSTRCGASSSPPIKCYLLWKVQHFHWISRLYLTICLLLFLGKRTKEQPSTLLCNYTTIPLGRKTDSSAL